jgi:hypothetical protein
MSKRGDVMQQHWRNPESISRRPLGTTGTILLAVHGGLLLLLACIVLCSPQAGEWVSESVQAEFVGVERPFIAPSQFAQPSGDVWLAESTH